MRLFRARLPNNEIVAIEPFSEEQPSDPRSLTGERDNLSLLLRDGSTDKGDFMTFVANVTSTVFREADPQKKVTVIETAEGGTYLAFELTRSRQIGVVEVMPLDVTLENLERVMPRMSRLARFAKDPQFAVAAAYIIAGRERDPREQIFGNIVEILNAQPSSVRLELLSWNQVVDRLSVTNEEPNRIVLIEIVNFSRRLLRHLLANPTILSGIDDRKFEELIATLLFDLGLEDIELTPARKDGGRDIVITYVEKPGSTRLRILIECKHWVSGQAVTMKWAMSLLEVAREENATAAVLLSSSGFGPRLLEQEAQFKREGLFLKKAEDLYQWLHVWERQYGSILFRSVNPRTVLGIEG